MNFIVVTLELAVINSINKIACQTVIIQTKYYVNSKWMKNDRLTFNFANTISIEKASIRWKWCQRFTLNTCLIDWIYKICGFISSRSITCCGMHSVGLMGFKRLSVFNKDKAAKPNSVWKISGILPVRSLKPPISLSWHDKMNCSNWSALIQCNRPIMVSDDSTHHE